MRDVWNFGDVAFVMNLLRDTPSWVGCLNVRSFLDSLKICKAVLVGDVAVGKTCLVNR